MSKVVKAVAAVGFIALGVFTGGVAFLPGTALAFTVGASTFLAVGIGLATSLILPELAGRPRRNASTAQLQIGEQPRQAILGRSAVGGTLVDAFNFGGKYGTDWEVQVIALADHRCDALEGFFVDDRYVAFAGDGNVAGFNNQLQVFWRSGTWDQAVPSILTTNGPGWTANDRGRGIAYVVVAYKADKSDAKNPVWPSGRPRFRWVVRGLRCYDPRKDSTAGGSGSHRWTDSATWEWSDNPIVARYNWVRGIYAGDRVTEPGHLLIGRGLSTIEAPPANVFARANLCDEQVNGAARYRIGGVVASIEPYIDVENDIAAACAGTISQPEGAVEVDPGEAKAPVAHFTDGDLIVGSEVRLSEFLSAGSDEWVNTVVATFVDPVQRWAQRSAPARRDLADIIADGGPREQQLRLELVTNGAQAGRVAEIARRFGRLWRRGQVTLPPRFAFIEEGDWVTWQSDRHFGGATFTFRVDAWGSDEGWRHQLNLRQISASVFSDTAPLDDGSIANDQPAPPVVAAPAEGAWSAAAVQLNGGGVLVPALRVTGATDDPAAQFVVFEYVLQGGAPNAGTVWTFASTSRPDVTRFDIPVASNGTFWVAVSYVVDGILGDRRVIGPIAAGALAYSDGTPIEEAFNELSAEAAQALSDAAIAIGNAATANAAIANITADNILSRDEKPEIRKQRDTIIGEYPTIRARGIALGVTVTNYEADYAALIAYLGGLSLDSATDTAITRTTFNTFFTDYYDERQNVLDGIANEASRRATVAGAEAGLINANVPLGNVNRMPFSRFEGGRGWLTAGNFNPTPFPIPFEGLVYIGAEWTNTAAGQNVFLFNNPAFPVNPGERLSISTQAEAFATAGGPNPNFWQIYIEYYDGAMAQGPGSTELAAGNGPLYGNIRHAVFSTVPASARFARLIIRNESAGAGAMKSTLLQPMVTNASADQTAHPPYTPGPNSDDGADVTSQNTAAFISGQSPWATFGASTGRVSRLQDDGFIQAETIYLPGDAQLHLRWPQEANANRTETRTAAFISGQGALATRNEILPSIGNAMRFTDNLIPDNEYRDLNWWGVGGLGNFSFLDADAGWNGPRILQFAADRDFDTASQYFTLETGSTYRIRTRIWNNNGGAGWSGAFWPLLHIPNQAWFSLRHGVGVDPGIADANNAVVANGDTGHQEFYFTPTNNSARVVQFRFKSTARGSAVLMQFHISKVHRLGRDLIRADSNSPYTIGQIQTDLGTAAFIVNQGAGATANNLAQLDPVARAELDAATGQTRLTVGFQQVITRTLPAGGSNAMNAQLGRFAGGNSGTIQAVIQQRQAGQTTWVNVATGPGSFISASEPGQDFVSATFVNNTGAKRVFEFRMTEIRSPGTAGGNIDASQTFLEG